MFGHLSAFNPYALDSSVKQEDNTHTQSQNPIWLFVQVEILKPDTVAIFIQFGCLVLCNHVLQPKRDILVQVNLPRGQDLFSVVSCILDCSAAFEKGAK